MALPNGHALRLLVAFQDLLLRFNPMEACSALPIIHFIRKSGVPSAMAPVVCCMLHASAIVAPVSCARSVKKAVPPSNHDE